MTNAVEVRSIGHAFNRSEVISDLTFQVPGGTFFIVIGPNGSGKTTLLKLMAGLLVIQRGQMAVLSRPIGDYSARELARRMAYVPQTAPVTFGFSVEQVVMMGRAPHLGMLGFESEHDLDLTRDAMRLAGVDHLAKRRLDQLSGGEQQRVFIARAICQQPALILLDEPTAALDLAHQVRVMDLMTKLKTEQEVTVVMVSHDLNLAAMYADHILLLNQGHPAGIGTPHDVLRFELLEAVYGCTLLVDKSPVGDYPNVHLVPGRYLSS